MSVLPIPLILFVFFLFMYTGSHLILSHSSSFVHLSIHTDLVHAPAPITLLLISIGSSEIEMCYV